MNNFELDKRAKELADSKTPYELARELLLIQDCISEAVKTESLLKLFDKLPSSLVGNGSILSDRWLPTNQDKESEKLDRLLSTITNGIPTDGYNSP